MIYEQTASTRASVANAWAALADVTSLPKWTESITAVEPLDGADLRVGNRYRIRQPGMGALVWRVSEVHDGESFVWEYRSPGIRTVAFHRLAAEPDGGTRITIGVIHSGWLAGVIAALTGKRTRRYLALEAAGLKAASESVA
jgi:uncharacterized protein YndB with AHSA1/START domain